MSQRLVAERWNKEYKAGRYDGEPPIPFVGKILDELGEQGKNQIGLYVGCGNGRNYVPMLEAGLRLHGMDLSPEAIDQIVARYPNAEGKVFVGDFADITLANVFDYITAIQVFQHGDKARTGLYFKNACDALKKGGKLFLRVNALATEIYYLHKVVEGNEQEGKTVLYEEGDKMGTKVHFYSEQELTDTAALNSFDIVIPPYEVTEQRPAPQTGTWTQWETIWQKKK